MFNRISSFVLAIILPTALILGSVNYLLMIAVVLGFVLLTTLINWKRLGFTWPHLFLPCIYLLSIGGVFVIITNPALRLVFVLLAAVIFFLLETNLGKESHLLQNIYLVSVFGLFLSWFALFYYFRLNHGWLVLGTFTLTWFLIVQGFAGFGLAIKKYFYFIIALLCAELAWGLAIWPTHYFVNAVIMFSFYYLLWVFAFAAFLGKLNRHKVYWQLLFVIIILIVVLATAAWKPLS